jgi:hypothetical protein
MPATLGTFAFSSFQGDIPHAHQRASVLPEQPGVNGLAVGFGGWVADPVECRTLAVAVDLSAAGALATSYRTATSTAVNLTLPSGRVVPVRIMQARVQDFLRTVTGAYLVPCIWTLVPAAAAP